MTTKIFDVVTELLANEDEGEVNRLMADLTRVLAIYNGVSWRSEVTPDLIKLHRSLGRTRIFKPELVDEALSKLESEGLIFIERRRRGAFAHLGTLTDKLIHLVNPGETLKALRRDRIFQSYMHERYRGIKGLSVKG